MQEQVKYWIDTAQDDICTAKILFESKRYLHMSFFCHLSAEKALKAILSYRGEYPPKPHNLIRLADLAGVYSSMPIEYSELLERLNPLNLEARYPTYKEQLLAVLTEDYCVKLLEETEGLLQWITKQLG